MGAGGLQGGPAGADRGAPLLAPAAPTPGPAPRRAARDRHGQPVRGERERGAQRAGARDHRRAPASARGRAGAAGLQLGRGPGARAERAADLHGSRDLGLAGSERGAGPVSDTIAGRYEVIEELGRGGVGRVVRALDTALHREVAVKTLLKSGKNNDRARFVEEAQITGQLNHPNVISVHDLGVDGDKLYLVMKLVAGQDLKQIRKRLVAQEPEALAAYPLRRLLRLFLEVCEAVAYAHARGVIHRDLKPANVMVSDADQVLLLDWGLAKAIGEEVSEGGSATATMDDETIQSRLRASLAMARSQSLIGAPEGSQITELDGDLTIEGQIVGTPAYMPPEQADSDADLDRSADVYALGSLLYELLTYEAPYRESTYQCLRRLIEGPPPDPSVRAPGNEIPPAVEAIVLKAMAREPRGRYVDAASLADDVRAFLDGERVSVYEESAKEAMLRLVRRHRVAVIATGVGFALLVTLIFVAAGLIYLEEQRVRRATDEVEREHEVVRAEEAAAARAQVQAELSAEGLSLVAEGLSHLGHFRGQCRSALPLAGLGAGTSRPTLFSAHAAARAGVETCRARLASVEAQGQPAALAELREQLERIRRDLDVTLVETILGERPSFALSLLGVMEASEGFTPPPDLQLELGEARGSLLARGWLRLGYEGKALAALAEPRDPVARALRAYLADEPLAELRAALDAALEAQPDAGWLHARSAEVRVREGSFAEARREFQRAISLAPRDAWVHSTHLRATLPPYADSEMLTNGALEILRSLSGDENRELEHVKARERIWRGLQAHERYLEQLEREVEEEGLAALPRWRAGARAALLANDGEAGLRFAERVLKERPGDL
ncbi:MAG TPA: hypothetical protein DEA08_13540, partial [Planctomycetes bacterium]|nr:hypothetical protein [Planctomycetota bacterium]